MLKRIHIKGYKSLRDVEMELKPLTVLVGPNAAGKSNFLDALQLLSRLAISFSLKDAFAPPCRGKPLESFSFSDDGLRGLRNQDSVSFSMEVDFTLSDFIVDAVSNRIRRMQHPSESFNDGSNGSKDTQNLIKRRYLRYRIKIEMRPGLGILRVADECLVALNKKGEPAGNQKALISIEKNGRHRFVRLEGHKDPIFLENDLDQTILSESFYPPLCPHLMAVREEIASWSFFYFEPRERMRASNPVRPVRHIGLMGEELPAYLNTLKAEAPSKFDSIEQSLKFMLPRIEGIDVYVDDRGEVELRLREAGVPISARVLSEGTLRMLGLLALGGLKEPPSLVGLEEPENGVHPRRIELVADLLKTRAELTEMTQYIVTTHSPVLVDWIPKKSLFVVSQGNKGTEIDPFDAFGPLGDRLEKGQKLIDFVLSDSDDADLEPLSVSERILRGDFGG
ncbi:MAG: AAA family ATPase [Gammaproteobacteria bacterium AqS3]|nr:AAA family ATPase [Gammaproteobacteria bacterium AqS3]